MNSCIYLFIHYSFFAFKHHLSRFKKLLNAWILTSYAITKIIVTLCNWQRNKVSPPLWQSVTNVITILKHVKFNYQKLLQLPKIPQIMNSQTTIHRHYSFSNNLKTNMIVQIMNRWIVFCLFLKYFLNLAFSNIPGVLWAKGQGDLYLSPLTTHLWKVSLWNMRNSNDILYKISPAREFCIKIFGGFEKNP